MSLRANIDHLAAAQGIVAVAVISPNTPREFRGDESWSAILDGALLLLEKTDESTIRLVVGKHTVVVQTESDETVAVVLPTGHAIAKSLRRMIRRMSRKVRAPLNRQTGQGTHVPTSPAPVAPSTTQGSNPGAAPSSEASPNRSSEPFTSWG
jgi:hypothetical protein